MKYYAYLKQHGEGCDYTIGCGNTLITIEADNDDDARVKLSEEISENYYGEQELEGVKLFKELIDFDMESVYSDMKASKEESKNKMQHIKDMEDFERLKKKLGQ